MKMIKVKTADASNYLTRQKWLDSIYKASNQLEKIFIGNPCIYCGGIKSHMKVVQNRSANTIVANEAYFIRF